jgi:hypothetical protein
MVLFIGTILDLVVVTFIYPLLFLAIYFVSLLTFILKEGIKGEGNRKDGEIETGSQMAT